MFLQQSKDVKHYYCNNCYLADSTKCINFCICLTEHNRHNSMLPPMSKSNSKPSAIEEQDSSLVKYVAQNRFKVTKTSQRQLPLYTGSISLPSPSSSKLAMDVRSIPRCSRDGPAAGLYWHIIHGSRLYISLRQIFYLDEDLHYWKLDESFCSPWKAEL